MTHITDEQLRHVARLSRLEFEDEELRRFSRDLNSVLDYIAKLNELDTRGVAPTSHALIMRNVFRPDVPVESLSNREALLNAPQRAGAHEEFFRVPQVLPADEEAS